MAALLVVLIDLPYDIMGIKLLWWTWHDTDTNIYDRSYWVPLTSYFFHMSFASSFTFLLNRSRRYFTDLSGTYSEDDIEKMPFTRKIMARNFWGEVKVLLTVGLCSFPTGVIQFVAGYHIPHDIFHIPTAVCVFVLVATYCVIGLWGVMHSAPVDVLHEGQKQVHRADKADGVGRWCVEENKGEERRKPVLCVCVCVCVLYCVTAFCAVLCGKRCAV